MAGRGGRSCPGQGDDTEGSRQTERKHSDTDKMVIEFIFKIKMLKFDEDEGESGDHSFLVFAQTTLKAKLWIFLLNADY